jgi:hypothetical protein
VTMHALILTAVISACRAIGICTGTGRHGSRQEIPGERRSPFQRSFLGNVFRQSVAQGICSLHGVACSQLRPSKSPPFREITALPLSSRPELRRSAVEGSAVVSSAANPKAVTTPALVIPTGAPQERSGEPALSEVEWGPAVRLLSLGNVFRQSAHLGTSTRGK